MEEGSVTKTVFLRRGIDGTEALPKVKTFKKLEQRDEDSSSSVELTAWRRCSG